MPDIFISYSKLDKDLVFSICNYLEKNGLTCWIAPRNIPPGTEYAAEIIKGIEECKLFLLMYSETSNQSQHVLREVGRAVHRNAPIIAYRIDCVKPTKSMEYFLETIQWLNAPYRDCIAPEALLHAIKNVINHNDVPVSTAPVSVRPSFLQLIHKYSAYISGSLLVAVLCLVFIIFKLNSHNHALTSEVSQMLIEKDALTASDAVTENTASPDASPSSTPSDRTASPDASTESKVPTADAPSADPSHSASNNSVGEADIPVVDLPDAEPPKAPAEVSEPSSKTASEPHTETPKQQKADSAQTAPPEPKKPSIKVGEYIQFGSYLPQSYSEANNDSKINWLVLHVDNGTALCISSKILDFKCFDGAESGDYFFTKDGYFPQKGDKLTPTQRAELFGNSDWATSNLRTWLNSGQAQVAYSDQPPAQKATSEHANGYSKQPGFLYHFSSAEKSLICPRTNSTQGNVLNSGTITTTDKVFLLSQAEVQKYLTGQNFVLYASPTQSAIASDKTDCYAVYQKKGYVNAAWFLRSPVTNSSTDVVLVADGSYLEKDFTKQIACISTVGIRPAIVINFGSSTLSGDGSEGNPYTLH